MPPADESRLSQIETQWTLIVRANAGGTSARDAQAELLPRYCAAVYRYLTVAAGDATAADDLCQEFAYRFVRGDFRHARPEKGRFRDYVKAAVVHLVGEYRRRAYRDGGRPLDPSIEPAAPDPEAFRREWTAGLLDRGWAALRRHGEETGQLLYAVLKIRADAPALRSTAVAEELTRQAGRPFTGAAVRQLLHRAREKYAELLWREVAESIPTTDPAEVAAELADLGLLAYCEPYLSGR